MSIDVSMEQLVDAVARYGFAYLLTVTEDLRVHAVAVTPVVAGDRLVIGEVGRHSRANAVARPSVSLVWPPVTDGDYSLIVDGDASLDGEAIALRPTRAVLHRPAPPRPGAPATCTSDCIPLETGPTPG